MKIKSLTVENFRHLNNLTFEIGDRITAIAGTNGTGKSSLLGLIAGLFICRREKTIFGKPFSAAFSEIFRFSNKKESQLAKEYKYFITTDDEQIVSGAFTYSSSDKRFFKIYVTLPDKTRQKMIFPVIYLGLRRLFPLSQETELLINRSRKQDSEYKEWFETYYSRILPTTRKLEYENYKSENKTFLSVVTEDYDSYGVSAGQDNLSQILSALYSFKTLKDEKKSKYKGGILLIDEVEVSLYPGAQTKLIEILHSLAGELKLQVIFTTHSVEILRSLAQSRFAPASKYVFLNKINDATIEYKKEYQDIRVILAELRHKTIKRNETMNVYCEDKEAAFLFQLLVTDENRKALKIHHDLNLDCNNYKKLLEKGFFKEDLVVLDGDANEGEFEQYNNVVFLPGIKNPENSVMEFLTELSTGDDQFWRNEDHYISGTFLSNREIKIDDRQKMKNWFKKEYKKWGEDGCRLAEVWKRKRPIEVEQLNIKVKTAIKHFRDSKVVD